MGELICQSERGGLCEGVGLASSWAAALVQDAQDQSRVTAQTIVRLDPALDVRVPPDAKLQLVKGGFGFTEARSGSRKVKRAISSLPTFQPM